MPWMEGWEAEKVYRIMGMDRGWRNRPFLGQKDAAKGGYCRNPLNARKGIMTGTLNHSPAALGSQPVGIPSMPGRAL